MFSHRSHSSANDHASRAIRQSGIVAAIKSGEARAALLMAEQLCRADRGDSAKSLYLRGLARAALRRFDLAKFDFESAYGIDPLYSPAALARLKFASPEETAQVARGLLTPFGHPLVLRSALGALASSGAATVICLAASDASIEGWAAWRGGRTLEIETTDGVKIRRHALKAEEHHPLRAIMGSAAFVSLPHEDMADAIRISAPRREGAICEPEVLLFEHELRATLPRLPRTSLRSIAIIAPVYEDFKATEACLRSLLADSGDPPRRVIVIDDCSPNIAIQRLLKQLSSDGLIVVRRNQFNIGFAASVNRAIQMTTSLEDVVIVNADTIVPCGAIARLRRTAYADDDIGSVTPLSNNGEYTSFPRRFHVNELPTEAQIKRIDQIASKTNAGHFVDIPAGVGFCMFVKRAMIDSVGPLSINYGRGYGEDVEWCLRASTAGFRHVCATDVFVAHHGTLSFRSCKRLLVKSNIPRLEEAYPSHRQVSAAFMKADPLALAIGAIEFAQLKSGPIHSLVVAPSMVPARLAQSYGSRLRLAGQSVVMLHISSDGGELDLRLRGPFHETPQSISLRCSALDADGLMRTRFGELDVETITFCDPHLLPRNIVTSLKSRVPVYDVMLSDAGSCSIPRMSVEPRKASSAVGAEASISSSGSQDAASWRRLWLEARFIIADSEGSANAIAAELPEIKVKLRVFRNAGLGTPPPRTPTGQGLGVVFEAPCDRMLGIVRGIHRNLIERQLDLPVITFGATGHDAMLRREGVTALGGEPTEKLELLAEFDLEAALLCSRRFGPAEIGMESWPEGRLPIACFDWRRETTGLVNVDLRICPSSAVPDVAMATVNWLMKLREAISAPLSRAGPHKALALAS